MTAQQHSPSPNNITLQKLVSMRSEGDFTCHVNWMNATGASRGEYEISTAGHTYSHSLLVCPQTSLNRSSLVHFLLKHKIKSPHGVLYLSGHFRIRTLPQPDLVKLISRAGGGPHLTYSGISNCLLNLVCTKFEKPPGWCHNRVYIALPGSLELESGIVRGLRGCGGGGGGL